MRRDKFAGRGLDKLLFTISDEDETVSILGGDIAGLEPAVRIKCLASQFRIFPVTGEHTRPFYQQLTIGRGLYLEVGQRLADGTDAVAARCGRIDTDHRRSLRETVALKNTDTCLRKPVGSVRPQRRTSRDEVRNRAAENLPHLAVEQLVGKLPSRGGRGLTTQDSHLMRLADTHGPAHDSGFDPGRAGAPLYLLPNLFKHARHRDDQRGTNAFEGTHQLVHCRAVCH